MLRRAASVGSSGLSPWKVSNSSRMAADVGHGSFAREGGKSRAALTKLRFFKGYRVVFACRVHYYPAAIKPRRGDKSRAQGNVVLERSPVSRQSSEARAKRNR